jgi:hypothetical protein
MGLTDNTSDRLINFLIPKVEEDYERIRNCPFDEDSNDIIYPDGSELVAIQMIAFQMQQQQRVGAGFQSESIGSYSYTKEKLIGGYPESITNKIKRYVSSR